MEITADINKLKKAGFITQVITPEALTEDNLSTFVTQTKIASTIKGKLDNPSVPEQKASKTSTKTPVETPTETPVETPTETPEEATDIVVDDNAAAEE